MPGGRTAGLVLILASAGLSLWWGISLGRSIPGGTNDLQVVYYATRCLIQHGDPYRLDQLKAVYAAAEQKLPPNSVERPRAVTWYIYLPPTFLIIAPLAILPWPIAGALWLTALSAGIVIAAALMVQESARFAPGIGLLLACLLLANCEVGFALGNAAVLVVSLCTIAAWCFFQERFALCGVVLLACALTLKPHDVVLVWLYFLLAGGAHRKRALQTLAVAAVLTMAAVAWVGQVAPHWLHEWNANIGALTVPGGLSDPGLSAEKGRSAGMVIDLQSALSVLKDDPGFYNPISHVVCGVLLLVWVVTTLRMRSSQAAAWYALAAAVPLTLLATYHRPYDAKLLLLALPACSMLWYEGGWRKGIAILVTASAFVLTADLPLTILASLTASVDLAKVGFGERVLVGSVIRSGPLALLAMAVFYLRIYVRSARSDEMALKAEGSAATETSD